MSDQSAASPAIATDSLDLVGTWAYGAKFRFSIAADDAGALRFQQELSSAERIAGELRPQGTRGSFEAVLHFCDGGQPYGTICLQKQGKGSVSSTFKRAGSGRWGSKTPASRISATVWWQVGSDGREIFRVADKKVLVKRSPEPTDSSWGFLQQGELFVVKAARAVDLKGREWVELTPVQLRRSFDAEADLDNLAFGFALIDGSSLGLPRLLEGPLPRKECFGGTATEEQSGEIAASFTRLEGYISAGADVLVAQMTVVEAMRKCETLLGCCGFTFKGNDDPVEPTRIHFKSNMEVCGTGWTSYLYEQGPFDIDSCEEDPKLWHSRSEQGPPERQSRPREPLMQTLFADSDHWEVACWELFVRSSRSEDADCLFSAWQGDVLILGGRGHRIWVQHVGRKAQWLLVPVGTQVLRQNEVVILSEHIGYALVQDGGTVMMRRGAAHTPTVRAVMQVVSGFGEPHRVPTGGPMPVRRADAALAAGSLNQLAAEAPVGTLREGEVVGVRRLSGSWAELSPDTEVWQGLRETALALGPVSGWEEICEFVDDLEVSSGAHENGRAVLQVRRTECDQQLWAGATSGKQLEKCQLHEGRLTGGLQACAMSSKRRAMYSDVLELCHERIYRENLHELWGGDRSRLPTKEALEAKLLDRASVLLHVRKGSTCCGGAVIKDIALPVRGGGSEAKHLSVCYIDLCASLPGSHAGSDIWQWVASAHFECVACHPILLQSTLDFWQARGLRRFDSAVPADCKAFAKQVMDVTWKCCELTELADALPPSKLPLFIFIPGSFVRKRFPG